MRERASVSSPELLCLAGRVPDKKPARVMPVEKIELARREEEQAVQPGQKWRGHIKMGAFGRTQLIRHVILCLYVIQVNA